MLNIRDVTKMQDLHDTIKNNKLLKRIYKSIASDFMGPFQSINYLCEIMVESNSNLSGQLVLQNCSIMKNAAKFASIKTKNFLDLNMIQRGTFRTNISNFSIHEICYDLLDVLDQHLKSKQVKHSLIGSDFMISFD